MDEKKLRILKRGSIAATAGAVAASMSACDQNSTICDPPPPPLCDRFHRDPPLSIESDRTTVALDDTVAFIGKITDDYFDIYGDVIKDLEDVLVLAPAGAVSDLVPSPPDSFSFRWTPRDEGGGFQPGHHEITIRLDVRLPAGEGSGPESDQCTVVDSIAVSIDSEGNAEILRLPNPSEPFGLYFKVDVEAVPAADGVRLRAVTSLRPEECEDAAFEWRAEGGTLAIEGDTALFRSDPEAGAGVVQVLVRLGDRSMAVGTWIP